MKKRRKRKKRPWERKIKKGVYVSRKRKAGKRKKK